MDAPRPGRLARTRSRGDSRAEADLNTTFAGVLMRAEQTSSVILAPREHGDHVMGKTTFLAAAALAVAGCSSPTYWVHPEKDAAARDRALAACQDRADAAFGANESDALGHGDFSAYGDLADQRRAMVETCMTEQGWRRYAGADNSQLPTAVEPPPAALPDAPVSAGDAASPAGTADIPPPGPTQSPTSAAIPAPTGDGPVSPPPASAASPPPAAAPAPTLNASASPPGAAPQPAGAPGPSIPAAATSVAESAAGPKSGSELAAEQEACEDEAESALSEASGAALAHGDLATYDELEARKEAMIRECLIARGWSEAELD